MRRFHANLHPRAQVVDEEKVGPIGGMILIAISENNPMTAQQIGTLLGRDKSQVSRVVGLLEKKGLIERIADEDDARSSTLHLSEAGTFQVAAFSGVMVETTKDLVGHLSREEVEQFSALLSKILDPGLSDQ